MTIVLARNRSVRWIPLLSVVAGAQSLAIADGRRRPHGDRGLRVHRAYR